MIPEAPTIVTSVLVVIAYKVRPADTEAVREKAVNKI
jgi:hypothetical protein